MVKRVGVKRREKSSSTKGKSGVAGSRAGKGKGVITAPKPKIRLGWGAIKPVTRVEADKKTPARRRVRELIRKGKLDE